ncbi:hypothetical protein [Streptococcus pasteurianus]|uniref:hypothetical protein n=1 Tax=Streptococcus pasteurianus TaxID=197614 RepID=UPI0030135369
MSMLKITRANVFLNRRYRMLECSFADFKLIEKNIREAENLAETANSSSANLENIGQ